ncbi:MAG: hypothetical protein AAF235_08665 [Planctomycetota bacterium]
MATTPAVFRPFLSLFAAALVLTLALPHASAQRTPNAENTREFGVIADPGDVLVFSVTTPQAPTPVYLYVFDDDGRPVVGSSGVGATTTLAQLARGLYYVAIWNGSTAPVPTPGFQISNVSPAQDFEFSINTPVFNVSPIRCPSPIQDLLGLRRPTIADCL